MNTMRIETAVRRNKLSRLLTLTLRRSASVGNSQVGFRQPKSEQAGG